MIRRFRLLPPLARVSSSVVRSSDAAHVSLLSFRFQRSLQRSQTLPQRQPLSTSRALSAPAITQTAQEMTLRGPLKDSPALRAHPRRNAHMESQRQRPVQPANGPVSGQSLPHLYCIVGEDARGGPLCLCLAESPPGVCVGSCAPLLVARLWVR